MLIDLAVERVVKVDARGAGVGNGHVARQQNGIFERDRAVVSQCAWCVAARALETGGFTTGENGEATGYWAPKAPEKPKRPLEIQARPSDYLVDT